MIQFYALKIFGSAGIVTFLAFSSITVFGQESVNSAGEIGSGSGGSTNYSIGQMMYMYQESTSGNVEQGVQHAYEIYTLGIKDPETTSIQLSFSVFPNPVVSGITVQINNYNGEKLNYQLYDMNGKLLNSDQIVTEQTKIEMGILPAATYFVNVLSAENKKIESFKIIKNQ
jgi:hypothetical protein